MTSFLFAQVFIVSFDRAYKEVSTKKYWKLSMAQFLWYVPSKIKVPSLWPWKSMRFRWIDNDPTSVLYEFQIDISTNSWEIKYQNMGICLLHVIDVFFVTSFLCSLKFLLFHRIEYPKRCLWKKNWNYSMAQFLWCDCTFKKQCTIPVTLTYEGQSFLWIEYNP